MIALFDFPVVVALRKESVDRNPVALLLGKAAGVALRKESVDRNIGPALGILGAVGSLSARRAWIEILCPFRPSWCR